MNTPTINETGRLAISMESLVRDNPHLKLHPISKETIILLVNEQGTTPPTWSIAAEPQWAYSALGHICRERAFKAEKGEILVDGKRLKAEAYLTLWRQATYSPMEWHDAVLRAGIIVTATVSVPAAYVADVLSATTREDRLREFLDTDIGKAATVDEANWTWTLPMDSIQNMLAFATLSNCYPGLHKYGHGKQVTFAVNQHHVETESANNADSTQVAQNDLFTEAA